MSNLLATISTSSAIFLILVIVFLIYLKKKEYKDRMNGSRALIKRTKRLRKKRATTFKEKKSLETLDDAVFESIWLTELEFYQNITKVICTPTENSIIKVTTYVSRLITPYYQLIDDVAGNSNTSEESYNNNAETRREPQSTNAIDQEKFDELEKRYQAQLQENNNLNNTIRELENENEQLSSNQPSGSDNDGSKNHIELLEFMMEKLATLAKIEHKPTQDMDGKKIKEEFKAVFVSLDKVIQKFDYENDKFEQTDALIGQLRVEKVENYKFYRKTMALLFTTYGEYANAFGLEAPTDPNIGIDQFEKFINDN